MEWRSSRDRASITLSFRASSSRESAGFDPTEFSGHSLRAGFVTSAAEKGATADRIMDHTGHRSVAMVRVYTRRADAFADHAALEPSETGRSGAAEIEWGLGCFAGALAHPARSGHAPPLETAFFLRAPALTMNV